MDKKKLGATGKYPQGKLSSTDEGEIQFAVGSDPRARKVVIDFGKPVAWLGMDPGDAEVLAQKLIEHARRARGGGRGCE